ncbi:Calcium-binding protein PBP1 [Glycine soja]|uniref:Calcium-binding protein PBP1 n=1 Tax=Glycine soja TaxID=3848 RepID=A0A0B2QE09_GLYSO|nr:Calcium-binding protein PBP1 [Glycine soja]
MEPSKNSQQPQHFHDYLPMMANKLGGQPAQGLRQRGDEDLRLMLRQGDFDGDGVLSQLEFCVLMFRLSPELMEGSKLWLEEVLQQDLEQ